ncbi:hypothetical protein L3Q67_03790 [Saccharothrix sp. AJ9571]|nr:hypothetical protein L3Q67_03790 [Saccharothrix sp. AJ9571]
MFRSSMVVCLALALSACAGEAPEQPPQQQQSSVYLQYAQCMRDNGVQVPDPRADDPSAMYEGVDTASAAFESADRTCGAILADVVQERQKQDPEQLKHQQEELLALAKCLREQGIQVPDPVPGQPGGAFGPGLDRTDPATAEALKTCATAGK